MNGYICNLSCVPQCTCSLRAIVARCPHAQAVAAVKTAAAAVERVRENLARAVHERRCGENWERMRGVQDMNSDAYLLKEVEGYEAELRAAETGHLDAVAAVEPAAAAMERARADFAAAAAERLAQREELASRRARAVAEESERHEAQLRAAGP